MRGSRGYNVLIDGRARKRMGQCNRQVLWCECTDTWVLSCELLRSPCFRVGQNPSRVHAFRFMKRVGLNLGIWSVLLVLLAAAVPAFACNAAGAVTTDCCPPGQPAPCSPATGNTFDAQESLSCCAASGVAHTTVAVSSAIKEIKKLDTPDDLDATALMPYAAFRHTPKGNVRIPESVAPPAGSQLYLSTLRLRL
jgi:hypothetical protein